MVRADFEGRGERGDGGSDPDVLPERHPGPAHHQRSIDQRPHLGDVPGGDDQQEVGRESVCEGRDDADPGVDAADQEHDPEGGHGEEEECGGGVEPPDDLPDVVFDELCGVFDVDQIGGHAAEHATGPLGVFAGPGSHVVDVPGHSLVLDDVVLGEHLAAELGYEIEGRGHEEDDDGRRQGECLRQVFFAKIHFTETLSTAKGTKKARESVFR